jgi:hypothetical protein
MMSHRATVSGYNGYSFIYLFNVTQCRHIGRCHTEQRYLVTMVTVLFISYNAKPPYWMISQRATVSGYHGYCFIYLI